MKKQDNHKKPRKLMDQVRDIMRLNRNRERISHILSKRIWGYREGLYLLFLRKKQ